MAMLRKVLKFRWTDQCEAAFQELRNALASTATLAFPRLDADFVLTVDASSEHLGVILYQLDETGKFERPIEYGGRCFRGPEKRYMIAEQECLVMLEGILAFHPYLVGRPFTIYTDHISLQWLQSIRASTQGRLARWIILLQGYDFKICYKPGTTNTAADALSRMDQEEPPPVTPDGVFLQDDICIRPQLELSRGNFRDDVRLWNCTTNYGSATRRCRWFRRRCKRRQCSH